MYFAGILLTIAILGLESDPAQAQYTAAEDTPVDSSAVVEGRPFDIENPGLRFFTKLAAGTASGAVFTGMSMIVLDKIYPPKGRPEENTYRELGFFLFGAMVGCSVGFPLGVTLVDPYNSLSKTLLAGVIPGSVGLGLIAAPGNELAGVGLLLSYIVAPISSLAVSEASRKPPQPSRISFGLAPTFNGGLSAAAQLRF